MTKLDKTKGGAALYQLKITLRYSKPPIWRRVLVRGDMPLDRLHQVIQVVMGWTDSHMHQFVADGTFYGMTDPGFGASGTETMNERKFTVAALAPDGKQRFIYEYDFGDSWEHDVLVEKVLPHDPGFTHPVCLAGKNNCPPDDCGGIGGSYNLLKAIADPHHPEHDDLKEWLNEDFDLAFFDLAAKNAALKRVGG